MYRRIGATLAKFSRQKQMAIASARSLTSMGLPGAPYTASILSPRPSKTLEVLQKRTAMVEGKGMIKKPEDLTIKIVEERVLKAIKAWDRFPQDRADKLTLDARFHEDLSFDSLDMVEIAMALEDEWDFEIPDDEMVKMKTPRDVVAHVCDHEDVRK